MNPTAQWLFTLLASLISVVGLAITLRRETKDSTALQVELREGLKNVKDQIAKLERNHEKGTESDDELRENATKLTGRVAELEHRFDAFLAEHKECRAECAPISRELALLKREILYIQSRLAEAKAPGE